MDSVALVSSNWYRLRRWFASVALLGFVAIAACSTPTGPGPQGAAAVTEIIVTGLETPPIVGATRQLAATVRMSDGTRKDATADVVWKSSDPGVVVVSPTAQLTVMAPGEADVTASYQDITGHAHVVVTPPPTPLPPTLTYAISGIVHESEPTQGVILAETRIEVVNGGSLNGQVFTTDAAGRFTLPAVTAPGFALKFKKRGYDDYHADIVQLPRDEKLDIGIRPLRVDIRRTVLGRLSCVDREHGTGSAEYSFPAHHDGVLTILELWFHSVEPTKFVHVYRNDQLVAVVYPAENCPSIPGGCRVPVQAGFTYRLSFGETCLLGAPPFDYRLTVDHPN